MIFRTYKHYFIVIGLLVFTSITLAISVDSSVSDEAGIYTTLPDQVGDWAGEEIWFCQNPEHQGVIPEGAIKEEGVCPECSGELASMTLIEKQLLPEDTVIVKKSFKHPDGRQIMMTLVMSGKERASIHRPERCLVGQGSEIASTEVIDVPFEGRKPFDVRILNMLRHVRLNDGTPHAFGRYYAYWFVGKDRETASHYSRMFWMAADRVLYNKSHRWAYISISGNRDLEDDTQSYIDEIREFTSAVYPQMVKEY